MPSAEVETDRNNMVRIGERTLDELVSNPPRAPENLFCSVCMTSGTSGGAPIVVSWMTAPGEIPSLGRTRMIVALGSRTSRLMFVLNMLNEGNEVRVVAPDNEDVDEAFTDLIADFAPDGMRGVPGFVLRMSEYLRPETTASVVSMQLLGEKFTPVHEVAFRERFRGGVIQLHYGALEIGHIGTQFCGELPRNCYHPIERANVEIAEPDRDGIGDILVSKDLFRSIGVRRYRNGDLGRWGKEPCACGRRYFELVGRQGLDRIKIAGALLIREEFDRVAALCKDLFEDYRVEAYQELHGGKLKGVIRLTVFAGSRSDPALRDAIAKRFSRELQLTRTRTLSQLATDGLFLPLEVEISARPFASANKDVKLRQRSA